jgi:hypothetical protein
MRIIESFNSFDTQVTIDDYMKQIRTGDYDELSQELFDLICEEGWIEQLEDEHQTEYTIDDFEHMTLKLSPKDRKGLMTDDENTIEKFNDLDNKLKEEGEYPYDTLDFIDYDNVTVHIIRLI